jgi:hypothetical protein
VNYSIELILNLHENRVMSEIKALKLVTIKNSSKSIQAAKKAGIDISIPKPHLPYIEQEQTDTM